MRMACRAVFISEHTRFAPSFAKLLEMGKQAEN